MTSTIETDVRRRLARIRRLPVPPGEPVAAVDLSRLAEVYRLARGLGVEAAELRREGERIIAAASGAGVAAAVLANATGLSQQRISQITKKAEHGGCNGDGRDTDT